jgi:hypothetical protein
MFITETYTCSNHTYRTYAIYFNYYISHYIQLHACTYRLPSVSTSEFQNRLYWCVAYLPSEASIIEH